MVPPLDLILLWGVACWSRKELERCLLGMVVVDVLLAVPGAGMRWMSWALLGLASSQGPPVPVSPVWSPTLGLSVLAGLWYAVAGPAFGGSQGLMVMLGSGLALQFLFPQQPQAQEPRRGWGWHGSRVP